MNQCSGYRIYLMWNAFRFLSIGILIFVTITEHNKALENIRSDCCNCYYISTEHGYIPKDQRFDLSYCIPECTDCTYCEAIRNDSTPSPIDSSNCEWGDYTERKTWANLGIFFHPSLNEVTGCDSGYNHISITSMYVFRKSYITNANAALSLGIIYWFINVILLFIYKNRYELISTFLYIYNVCIAELCLYCLFMPHQYHREILPYEQYDDVQCEIDSNNSSVEDMLTGIIFISFGLVFCQIIYCVTTCCMLCKRVCFRRPEERKYLVMELNSDIDEPRPPTILKFLLEMHKIDDDGNAYSDTRLCRCDKPCCLYYCYIVVAVIIVMIMVFFLVIIVFGHVIMIKASYQDTKEDDTGKQIYIWVINVLLFLSLLDIWFFPFCFNSFGKFLYRKIKAQLRRIISSDDDDDLLL